MARQQRLLKQLEEDVWSAQGEVQAALDSKAGSKQSLLQAEQQLDTSAL